MVAATLGGAAMQTNHLFATQSTGQAVSQRATEDLRTELAGLKADLSADLDARIAAALAEHAKVRMTLVAMSRPVCQPLPADLHVQRRGGGS